LLRAWRRCGVRSKSHTARGEARENLMVHLPTRCRVWMTPAPSHSPRKEQRGQREGGEPATASEKHQERAEATTDAHLGEIRPVRAPRRHAHGRVAASPPPLFQRLQNPILRHRQPAAQHASQSTDPAGCRRQPSRFTVKHSVCQRCRCRVCEREPSASGGGSEALSAACARHRRIAIVFALTAP
jgi:hypothetical protein